jgi:uncharacterized membrane protein
MRTRAERRVAARNTWDRLEVSFWFAPAIMSAGAVLLAWAMFALDSRVPNAALASSRFVLSGTVGEMRSALLNMAGTVLATAGVVFTLLTLPLSTVAAQYGSRLLRVFLGDRTTQFVLGMFVGTFVYCMAAALSIPPASVEQEAPQLTATVGVYLMLATFGTLILLVQHISTMLQAPNIAAAAGDELREVIDAGMPPEVTSDIDATRGAQLPLGDAPDDRMEAEGYAVRARRTGYLQYIDPDIMLTLAGERDLVIRLLRKPGDYIHDGALIALASPAAQIDEQLDRLIRRAFRTGNGRTPTQDIEYAVNQLTEMAVRAMSPAINDPFTAMTCLDHIGHGLAHFARQGEMGSHYYNRDGKLRLIMEPVTLAELLGAAFDMLRHASCDNASVLLRMLDVIELIGREAKSPEAHRLLLEHACLIEAESQVGDLIEQDRQAIRLRGQTLRGKLADAA